MKILFMQFPASSCYFTAIAPKYSRENFSQTQISKMQPTTISMHILLNILFTFILPFVTTQHLQLEKRG